MFPAELSKKTYLYHVTKPENVKSILQTGLRRDGGGRQTIAIYLSESPLSWYQPGLVILKVLIEGLTGDMTTFLPEQDEILYWGDIEPGRISWAGCLTCRKNNNCGTKVAYDPFESLDPNSRRPICRDYESSEKEDLKKDHGE